MDNSYRRLDKQVDKLRTELQAEREARKDQADRLKRIEGRPAPRKRSTFRWLAIGGGAYLLGAKAGRPRYEQIMAKGRQLRDGARQALTSDDLVEQTVPNEAPIPTKELRASEL